MTEVYACVFTAASSLANTIADFRHQSLVIAIAALLP